MIRIKKQNQQPDLHEQTQGEVQYLYFDFFNKKKWTPVKKKNPEHKSLKLLKNTIKWYLLIQVLGVAFFIQSLSAMNFFKQMPSDAPLLSIHQALKQDSFSSIYDSFQKGLTTNDFRTYINSLRAINSILNDKPVYLPVIVDNSNKNHETTFKIHQFTMEEKVILSSLALSSEYKNYEQDEAVEQQITDHCGPLGINNDFFFACYAVHTTTPGQDRMNNEDNEMNAMTQIQQWIQKNATTIHASDSLSELLTVPFNTISNTRDNPFNHNTLPQIVMPPLPEAPMTKVNVNTIGQSNQSYPETR
jgi:hypothetical protein